MIRTTTDESHSEGGSLTTEEITGGGGVTSEILNPDLVWEEWDLTTGRQRRSSRAELEQLDRKTKVVALSEASGICSELPSIVWRRGNNTAAPSPLCAGWREELPLQVTPGDHHHHNSDVITMWLWQPWIKRLTLTMLLWWFDCTKSQYGSRSNTTESDHHQQQAPGQTRLGFTHFKFNCSVIVLHFFAINYPVISRGPVNLALAIFLQFIKIDTNGQRLKFPMNLKLVGSPLTY